MNCPACGHGVQRPVKGHFGIYRCAKCGAIHGECYLGDSYALVKPLMTADSSADAVYFDFTCVGSQGITRRHGWFDPKTKLIVQVG